MAERDCPLSEKIALSVHDTAVLLSVSERMVYDLLHRSDFPALKIGGRTLVSRSGLEEWIAAQAQNSGVVVGTFGGVR